MLQTFREGIAGSASQILALGLSSRKNLCVHPRISEESSRESVDAGCRRLTAHWNRQRAGKGGAPPPPPPPDAGAPGVGGGEGDAAAAAGAADVELCDYFEDIEAAGAEAMLPPGVYTLHDLRVVGKKKRWCPYFLARRLLDVANVVVYSYQYLLDPKATRLPCGPGRWGPAAGAL